VLSCKEFTFGESPFIESQGLCALLNGDGQGLNRKISRLLCGRHCQRSLKPVENLFIIPADMVAQAGANVLKPISHVQPFVAVIMSAADNKKLANANKRSQ